MIPRLLAALQLTRPDYSLTPSTTDGHTVWTWRCNLCRSGRGQSGDYDRADRDARVHLAAAHGTVEARS